MPASPALVLLSTAVVVAMARVAVAAPSPWSASDSVEEVSNFRLLVPVQGGESPHAVASSSSSSSSNADFLTSLAQAVQLYRGMFQQKAEPTTQPSTLAARQMLGRLCDGPRDKLTAAAQSLCSRYDHLVLQEDKDDDVAEEANASDNEELGPVTSVPYQWTKLASYSDESTEPADTSERTERTEPAENSEPAEPQQRSLCEMLAALLTGVMGVGESSATPIATTAPCPCALLHANHTHEPHAHEGHVHEGGECPLCQALSSAMTGGMSSTPRPRPPLPPPPPRRPPAAKPVTSSPPLSPPKAMLVWLALPSKETKEVSQATYKLAARQLAPRYTFK